MNPLDPEIIKIIDLVVEKRLKELVDEEVKKCTENCFLR